jgi:ribosomal protein S18 acetylase RimI-like enzyme
MVTKVLQYGGKEYLQMVALRTALLRAPLGLSFEPKELAKERTDLLLGVFKEEALVGCCLLTSLDKHSVRLRQMAVQKEWQGLGIGRSLLVFAENTALEHAYSRITLHAREGALGFYEKLGYQIESEPFIEVGIMHYAMGKELR